MQEESWHFRICDRQSRECGSSPQVRDIAFTYGRFQENTVAKKERLHEEERGFPILIASSAITTTYSRAPHASSCPHTLAEDLDLVQSLQSYRDSHISNKRSSDQCQ